MQEKQLIPILKKIRDGNPDAAEFKALTQAMDILHDYEAMANQNKTLMQKYEVASPAIKRGMDIYQCPACGKRTSRNHTHCHWCGKKLGW